MAEKEHIGAYGSCACAGIAWLRLCVTGVVMLLFAADMPAGQPGMKSCGDRLRSAFQRHCAAPDSGTTVRRVLRVTSIRRIPDGLDTSVAEIETIDGGDLHIIRSDSLERWEDGRTMIVLDRQRKTVRIIELEKRRSALAAQKKMRSLFCDSLVDMARTIECEEARAEPGDLIRGKLQFGLSTARFYNASAITVDIDAHGEIVRFAVKHPSRSSVRQTTYAVLESERNCTRIDPARPAAQHFFEEDGRLRPEYEDYKVIHGSR